MGNKVLLLRFPCVVFKILFFLIPGSFHQTKSDMIPEFITFDAVSHPNIPAMFYANPYTKIL